MLTTKAICTLLLGASLGAGGVVTVQKKIAPKPTQSAKAQGKLNAGKAARPRVARPVAAQRPASPPSNFLSCPEKDASPFSIGEQPIPDLGRTPKDPVYGGGGFSPVTPPPGIWGGGGGGGHPTSPAPGVPDAATWMQLIAGFGLIGLAGRRRRVA